MIRLRTWMPLSETVSLHETKELALDRVIELFDAYTEEMTPEREAKITLDDVMDMFSICNIGMIDKIRERFVNKRKAKLKGKA